MVGYLSRDIRRHDDAHAAWTAPRAEVLRQTERDAEARRQLGSKRHATKQKHRGRGRKKARSVAGKPLPETQTDTSSDPADGADDRASSGRFDAACAGDDSTETPL